MFQSPIIVVGIQRSGTSFVAETLIKKFGVRFGYEAYYKHPKLGLTYEDARIVKLNQRYTNGPPVCWQGIDISDLHYQQGMKKFFKQMAGGKGLWGFKDPRLLLGLRWTLDYFYPKCTIIRTYRPIELIVKSLIEKAGWPDAKEAKQIVKGQLKIIDNALVGKKCIEVRFSNKKMSELELITTLTGGKNLMPLIKKQVAEVLNGRQ